MGTAPASSRRKHPHWDGAPGRVTVSGIVTVGSGRPYNITAGRDLNEDGAAGNDRPWRQKNDLTTRIGRNTGLLPGTSTVDVRVAKRLMAGDRALDLIAEVFNLFNHTNYTAVDAVFGDGAYPNTACSRIPKREMVTTRR